MDCSISMYCDPSSVALPALSHDSDDGIVCKRLSGFGSVIFWDFLSHKAKFLYSSQWRFNVVFEKKRTLGPLGGSFCISSKIFSGFNVCYFLVPFGELLCSSIARMPILSALVKVTCNDNLAILPGSIYRISMQPCATRA